MSSHNMYFCYSSLLSRVYSAVESKDQHNKYRQQHTHLEITPILTCCLTNATPLGETLMCFLNLERTWLGILNDVQPNLKSSPLKHSYKELLLNFCCAIIERYVVTQERSNALNCIKDNGNNVPKAPPQANHDELDCDIMNDAQRQPAKPSHQQLCASRDIICCGAHHLKFTMHHTINVIYRQPTKHMMNGRTHSAQSNHPPGLLQLGNVSQTGREAVVVGYHDGGIEALEV